MTHSRTILLAVLALLASSAMNAFGQNFEESEAQTAPDLTSLDHDWWSYFEGAEDDVKVRVDAFLIDIGTQVSGLEAANEPAGRSAQDAIRENFSAYIALLDENMLELLELPRPRMSYTLDGLLRLAVVARQANDDANDERFEVEREQRILDGASRRRDLAFKAYVDAEAGDAKLLSALQLVQTRTAQAIATRRLQRLTESYEHTSAYASDTAARVIQAGEALAITADEADLEQLKEQVETDKAAASKAQEEQRTAELAAIGLDLDTAKGRSEQRLAQQKMIDAGLLLARSNVSLANARARLWWTELHIGGAPDLDSLQEQDLERRELLRSIKQNMPVWQRDSEDELLAVQRMNRDGMERASRRLLDQRIGVAQGTLARLRELHSAVADLELLGTAVDSAAADYSGAFKSWTRGASRNINSAYARVVGLADVTLFSIGETPVTGRDILRVIIILLLAFLLSRGIRYAIKRFSDKEFSGRQASLYTVGRLTHYAIIIIAIFTALTSIGLDFSSLALVAGALSVGIGFGLQSIVSNFVSGLIILFEHTLRVGDYIELDANLTGTVKSINVRSTLITTNDNIDIVVPNSEFVTTRLTNWTLGERVLRVRIPFGVAYGTDKELVKKAALEAADEVSYTLTHIKGREPDVWLVNFGDSSLDFIMTVWVNRQGARRPTRTRASYLWALESKLQEYGIEIPFP